MGASQVCTQDHTSLCVQLPTSADNVTLLAFAAERRPCSSQSIILATEPTAAVAAEWLDGRSDEQTHTHRQTDRHSTVSLTLFRIIAYYASSVDDDVTNNLLIKQTIKLYRATQCCRKHITFSGCRFSQIRTLRFYTSFFVYFVFI